MGSIADADLAFIVREVRARTGLALDASKAQIVESRVAPIARREGLLSVQELASTVSARREDRLIEAIADALIDKETQFFRDRSPFAYFRRTMAPELLARRPEGQRLRIWSAGCSTGQEPFSLAMMGEDMKADGKHIEIEIVATDISAAVLEKARSGVYNQFDVQRGLPIRSLIAHFEKIGDLWRVNDRVRARVKFEKRNLLADPSSLGQFDIIFCRNVLSSLEPATAQRVLDKLCDRLAPDGYIVFGAHEMIESSRITQATIHGGVYTFDTDIPGTGAQAA
jgi:chemotaxis protein methyltransferase CheR